MKHNILSRVNLVNMDPHFFTAQCLCRQLHKEVIFHVWFYLPGTTFHWLPVKDLYRTASSRMDLVIHHVFQTLVVCRTDEYLCRQLSACVSIVEYLHPNSHSQSSQSYHCCFLKGNHMGFAG